jgi:hypothetical protein
MGVVEPDTRTIERELTGALGMWATGSVAAGAALNLTARLTDQPWLASFARQQIGWGAVDGAIAGFGAWRQRGQGPSGVSIVDDSDRPTADAMQQARRLHTLLKVNTALDVVYVAAGLATVAAARPLARRFGRTTGESIGAGVGVIVQGGFLLVLDGFFARRVGIFIADMEAAGTETVDVRRPSPTTSS